MEEAQYKKPLKRIIKYSIIIIALMIAALIFLYNATRVDDITGGNGFKDPGWWIGSATMVLFGIVVPGAIIVLAILAISLGEKNPDFIKGFSIGCLIAIFTVLGVCTLGLIRALFADLEDIAKLANYLRWQMLIYHSLLMICVIIALIFSIFAVINGFRAISLSKEVSPNIGASKIQPTTQNPAGFCPECGTPYEEGQQFCRKCGKTL